MLKIGWIDYANCTPLLLQIEHQLSASSVTLVHGVPAQLNAALAAGSIDLCISSSIEFARHADDYLVLPGHCIGSRGAVQSVLLLSNRPVADLSGQQILMTAESATSVVLLQILAARHWKLSRCSFQSTTLPWHEALGASGAVLVIGDTALRAAMAGTAPFCYDLGAEWFAMSGLPFVYALWQVNRAAAVHNDQELRYVLQLLDSARDQINGQVHRLAEIAAESAWMGVARLADYWQHITYRLDDDHLSGLELFYQLAHEQGVLAQVPTLHVVKV